MTPSQIYAWEGLGPDVDLTQYTEERMPSEQKWYALTGRVVDAKVEADDDIHIALVDATGDNVGTVSAEIPVGPKWCEIRQIVFGQLQCPLVDPIRNPYGTSARKFRSTFVELIIKAARS